MENFPHSHSREVKATIMALPLHPTSASVGALSFNYAKVVVLLFQKFFS